KVQPRVFVGVGILAFAVSTWQMSHYTLATSPSGIVGALMVQGLGFSFLFVPLTTVALASIPRQRMPDATGLNSLMRQIGGSIGLAAFATLMTRYMAPTRMAVAQPLTAGRPEVAERLGALTQY